jgi:hypothetical protein
MTCILPGSLGLTGGAAVFSAWLPSTVNGTVPPAVFSNSNRTMAGSQNGNVCRGNLSHNTGKFYFEVTVSAVDGYTSIGVVNPSWIAVSSGPIIGYDANGVSLVNNGTNFAVVYNNTYPYLTSAPPAAGDVLGVAVDFVTGSATRVYFRQNTLWCAQGTNVATFNAALPDFTWGAITTLFPAGSASNVSNITINVGNAAFAHAPPAGFVAWG